MFNEALTTITDQLADHLVGQTTDVASHPGRFTEEELSRLLTARKAVRVAMENTQSVSVNGKGIQEAKVLMAAYVICSDAKNLPRHQSALAITESIIEFLPFNRFESDKLKPVLPPSIAAENLYSGEVDRKGIALWGISWEQTIIR